jgi:DNA repair protein NreA
MSARSVDTEVHLSRRPNLELRARVGDITAPMGPTLDADRARLAENPRVEARVERAVSDVHATAATSAPELRRAGAQVHEIERLLSVGLLGQATQRRLVPTRWSITATDDLLGKALIPKVMDAATVDSVEVYEHVLHGNRFNVFLLPQVWSFDMIETWIQGAMWALETSAFIEDHEDWRGRSSYASNITGAYYAARLSVLEHLAARKRQAGVFVYREITPEYWAPLGVWVIREAVKGAMNSQPMRFASVARAVAHVERRTLKQGWARQSVLLGQAARQRRLSDFA